MTNANMHMKGYDEITLRLIGGANIKRVVKEAIRIAAIEDVVVRFVHNDFEIVVSPESIEEEILSDWNTHQTTPVPARGDSRDSGDGSDTTKEEE